MKSPLITTALVTVLSLQAAVINAAQIHWTLGGLDQPESSIFNPKSGEILVSNINGSPVELNAKGYISRISSSGEMLQQHWVEGLDAPKGMALFEGKLYIADMQKLHVVDAKTGDLVKSYFAKSSKMLNDISVDDSGNVYVSDLLGGGIYRLHADNFAKWFSADAIAHPNGLLVEKGSLYIANWGQGMQEDFSTDTPGIVYKLALNDPQNTLQAISEPLGNLDGLVRYKDRFIVNDWINGNVFSLKAGKSELLFNAGKAASDINLYQNQLVVPVMFDNRLDVYELGQ